VLIVTKQIVSYIYMFYNIIENFVELFHSSVSCILCSIFFFFFIIKIYMPPIDEYLGSATGGTWLEISQRDVVINGITLRWNIIIILTYSMLL
jgi:hypothetical protein